jgi:hypothetical protein
VKRSGGLPGAPKDLNLEAWRAHYTRTRVNPVPGSAGLVTIGPDGKPVDYQTARTMKTAYQAERERMAVETAKRQLIPAEEVSELLTKIAATIRGRFLRMPSELALVLAGRTEAEIERIAYDKVCAALAFLSEPERYLDAPSGS